MGNYARAEMLIANLAQYLLREADDPLYPQFKVTDEQVRLVFTQLDEYLNTLRFYPVLEDDVVSLVATAKTDGLAGRVLLTQIARQVADIPDLADASRDYIESRSQGQLTCFYCDKNIHEADAGASTELGVFYACAED